MLSHPVEQGVRTVRGAAVIITRCRIMLAAGLRDVEADMNVMLLRDNLLERWGEPDRLDTLQSIAFLGISFAEIVELHKGDELYEARVRVSREMWRALNPTGAETAAVRRSLEPFPYGFPANRPVVEESASLPYPAQRLATQ